MTVFISIAAYRDPELAPTVRDCLAKALRPDRLRFGICWQHGPEDPPFPFVGDPAFRVLSLDWRQSRGACWARAEIMRLYDGEDYYLQLDSHHRFVEGWDQILLDQLEHAGGDRAVLTTYAPAFTPGRPLDRHSRPTRIEVDGFTDEGIPLLRPAFLTDRPADGPPLRARFLSAHFLFACGQFVDSVPYDPELYFIGEEISLTVRAYTHGFNLFHPGVAILWHEYSRAYRSHHHWTDHLRSNGVSQDWHEWDRLSRQKVERLLTRPWIGGDGCGNRRTLSDYENYAGISFNERRLQDYTRRGLEPPNPPTDPGWATRMRHWRVLVEVERAVLTLGAVEADFWYLGVHDAEGRELVRKDLGKAAVQEAISTVGNRISLRCEVIAESKPASWTVWPYSADGGWLDRIDGAVLHG